MDEIKTYLEHSQECLVVGDTLEAKAYINDALAAIERQSPRVLPVFNGYTVDERLRAFRKAIYGKSLEFIPFDSPKGIKLLKAMRK